VTTLLHLDSSANRTSESVTRRLTALFAQKWRAANGDAGYRYRDLAADPVQQPDTAYCALGRRVERHGLVPLEKVAALAENEAEEREWALALPMIREVRAAGTILIGAPMYNLSVPAALKAWIDRITFPGAFTDPGTGVSVLAGTRVVVVAARGGAYGPGTPGEGFDFQLPYLRAYFRRYGVPDENIRCVAAELTLAGIAPHMARFRPEADRSLSAATAAVTAVVADLEDVARPA
jgi:FMN-dependent NADH-azoreductase